MLCAWRKMPINQRKNKNIAMIPSFWEEMPFDISQPAQIETSMANDLLHTQKRARSAAASLLFVYRAPLSKLKVNFCALILFSPNGRRAQAKLYTIWTCFLFSSFTSCNRVTSKWPGGWVSLNAQRLNLLADTRSLYHRFQRLEVWRVWLLFQDLCCFRAIIR